jgi:hypothetical protein
MGRVEQYREVLRHLEDWEAYLLQESCLPGPRANLELAYAVGLEGSEELFLRFASLEVEAAPANSPEVYLAVCGVLGLGYLAARGGRKHFSILRDRASDSRWRVREAVALGLQKYGQATIEGLLRLMSAWSEGSLLERRAVVASLCEPILLTDRNDASRIIDLIDAITASVLGEEERRTEEFRILRKALGYGWSVVVAAQPGIGKPRMERWISSDDLDIRWIMKQNLKKKRLWRMDESWVQAQLKALE